MNVPFMVLIFLGQSETLKFKLNTYCPGLKNAANICVYVINSCQILKIPKNSGMWLIFIKVLFFVKTFGRSEFS